MVVCLGTGRIMADFGEARTLVSVRDRLKILVTSCGHFLCPYGM